MPKEIILGSTPHDPRGVFAGDVQQVSHTILRHYAGWVVNVTQTTDRTVIDALNGSGVYLTKADPKRLLVPDSIENDHLHLLSQTAERARNLGLRRIQYTDGDRIIVAAKYFPKDFRQMAILASYVADSRSYLNLRRSPTDLRRHPVPLIQTEIQFYLLYNRAFGMPIDIGSTAHVMSLDVAQEIIGVSPKMESVSFPHPKWLIIAKKMGTEIQSVETHNVLTFETPEQFRKEIEKEIGSGHDYSFIQQAYMRIIDPKRTFSSEEWKLRFETERQYLTLLQNHIHELGLDDQTKGDLTDEAEELLVGLKRLRRIVLETFELDGKETK